MAFLLENAFNGTEMVEEADKFPLLRMFTNKKDSTATPQHMQPKVEENWAVSSKAAVSMDGCPKCANTTTATGSLGSGDGSGDDNWLYMSAVCYIYGREIQKKTGLPVGLVNTNWGGTPDEFWMSEDALASIPRGVRVGHGCPRRVHCSSL